MSEVAQKRAAQGYSGMLHCALGLLYSTTSGGTMQITKGRAPAWAILSAIGLAGVVLIFLPVLFSGLHDHRALFEGFGVALVTSFILGFTIDRWMKAEIARDVFSAAVGYMLPEDFRNEVNRIVSYKLFATKHTMRVVLEPIPGTECVRATIEIERTVQNITGDTQKIKNMSHIDEWDFDCERSRIDVCEIEGPDGEVHSGRNVQALPSRVRMETDEITLFSGQSATLRSKLIEIRRINDHVIVAFTTPIRNPTIVIVAPDSLQARPGFGSVDTFESARFESRHTMMGTYFPGIHMSVRWHPKEQIEWSAGSRA
jgi:hypothetical protein